jgi:hypothetical protein
VDARRALHRVPAVNWFAELGAHPDDLAEAKAVCARCMVREGCLEYAESRPACRDHGVLGRAERPGTPRAAPQRGPQSVLSTSRNDGEQCETKSGVIAGQSPYPARDRYGATPRISSGRRDRRRAWHAGRE